MGLVVHFVTIDRRHLTEGRPGQKSIVLIHLQKYGRKFKTASKYGNRQKRPELDEHYFSE